MSIYFVQAGNGGPIKIGFTDREPSARLAQLRSSCPEPITILALIPGSREKEAALHKQFSAHHKTGEWFHPHKAILEYAAALPVMDGTEKCFRHKSGKSWQKLTAGERRKAKYIWFEPAIESDSTAASMAGYSRAFLRLHLGPSGRIYGHKRRAQAGSKGGIQAGKNARKDRPPFTAIKPIWFDRSLDDVQVMQAIADLGYPKEISYTTIWREFGRRYGSDGRRAAKKQ